MLILPCYCLQENTNWFFMSAFKQSIAIFKTYVSQSSHALHLWVLDQTKVKSTSYSC